jgi:hypothetical protein
MDLPCGGQAPHRFPYPRARGKGREKNLDLLARGGENRLQIHGNQQRQGGYLPRGGSGCERIAVPYPEQLPANRLRLGCEYRADAQALPELVQRPQHRRFGHLAPQRFAGLGSAERTLLVQRFPQLQHQGRDFVSGGLLRSLLPITIRAQAEHVRQRLAMNQKIRLFTHSAQQVERYYASLGAQTGQPCLRLLDGCHIRRGLGTPQTGFHKGRGRRRQLRPPGQIKAQGMLFEPAFRVVEGEEGALVVAPVRRPCCLELLCCQMIPRFRSRLKCLERFRNWLKSKQPGGCLPRKTTPGDLSRPPRPLRNHF